MSMQLFNAVDLNEAELKEVELAFKNPVIQKYLTTLAAGVGEDMVSSLNTLEIGTELYMRNQFYLKGKIDALTFLHDLSK